ncbi:IgA peptidase M64-domain-containing protein [Epithele typhae]|uniref:IgA peptidase M64-domain-containing protein n=1 Tax=Epithele typhae TaxID=378194 RepID=UPI0020075D99|nr:IgA peptidase M64-domain-containing protein [Epithele typhae]KAH9932711.1 IgA peptidase M64-domain-containing protein [Epithele typhae]
MFSRSLLALALGLTAFTVAAEPTARPFEVVVNRDPRSGRCTFLKLTDTQPYRGLPREGLVKRKALPTGEEGLQFITPDETRGWEFAERTCGDRRGWDFHVHVGADLQGALGAQYGRRVDPPPLDVEPLITSGDADNRVDLVFFSDGYTEKERGKFFEDALRLADDISGNQTFYTVKPLLNFWAAFTPSAESGVGIGGKPKDTPFGLYRDGTELRGVYYSKPEVARAACASMGSQCDYPILMGNDPLYGGASTVVLVITPSLANGPLVLRHELGHSIIEVGEEYDGGFAYFGVNAAHNTTIDGIPWAHWLTPTKHDHDHNRAFDAQIPLQDQEALTTVRVERSVMPLQIYAWTMLNTSASWTTNFTSSGTYSWSIIRFSLSGLPSASDLSVTLDGKDLGWVPRTDIGLDRWHYDIKLETPMDGGEHVLNFTLLSDAREGVAQLCSVEVLEFGSADEFVATPGHYGLYPTFSETNETSFRPTNEDCLMRIVTTPDFCKSCTEGLWHALLRRVSLVDGLAVGCASLARAAAPSRVLDLALVPLAHLRAAPVGVDEALIITWTRDGVEVPEFANATRFVDDGGAVGSYAVRVRYATEEVRVDPDGLLEATAAVVVTTRCG